MNYPTCRNSGADLDRLPQRTEGIGYSNPHRKWQSLVRGNDQTMALTNVWLRSVVGSKIVTVGSSALYDL